MCASEQVKSIKFSGIEISNFTGTETILPFPPLSLKNKSKYSAYKKLRRRDGLRYISGL